MARPQRLNADYFSHDANASSDEKILYLESKFGLTGYAVYFKLLEVLANADNFILDWNDIKCSIYARKFGIEKQVLSEIIVAATTPEIALFHLENGRLWSGGLQKRLGFLLEKRKNDAVRIAEKRQNAVVAATIGVVAATTPQSKVNINTTSSSNAHAREGVEIEKNETLKAEQTPAPPIAPSPPPPYGFDLEAGLKDLRENYQIRDGFTLSRKIPPDKFAEFIEAFESDIRARGQTYPNLPDFRNHFLNFSAKRWQIECAEKKSQNRNGTNRNDGNDRVVSAYADWAANYLAGSR